MSIAPILTTDRLRLRPHRAADFAAMCTLWQHPHTYQFIGGTPQDDQTIWFRLLRYAGLWDIVGYGFWAVEDKASGAFLGEGGLMDAHRGVPMLDAVPEAGWAFIPETAGQGIATEAMRAIFAWADKQAALPPARCIIAPENIASHKVAAKLGFTEIGSAELGGAPLLVLERPIHAAASIASR